MDAERDGVSITPVPSGDAFLVEWRGSDAEAPAGFRVARSVDRTHWLVYNPAGAPVLRSPRREQAIDFAARLAEAGHSAPD